MWSPPHNTLQAKLVFTHLPAPKILGTNEHFSSRTVILDTSTPSLRSGTYRKLSLHYKRHFYKRQIRSLGDNSEKSRDMTLPEHCLLPFCLQFWRESKILSFIARVTTLQIDLTNSWPLNWLNWLIDQSNDQSTLTLLEIIIFSLRQNFFMKSNFI